jgi:hypothetical protein
MSNNAAERTLRCVAIGRNPVSLELREEVVLASFLSGNRSLDHSAMTESRHLFK